MTELERYRAEERRRLVFGLDQAQDGEEDEAGFNWKKGFAPPGGGNGGPDGEEPDRPRKKKRPWFDYLIISENSKAKATYDIYINLLVAFSCFTTIYFVSFDDTPPAGMEIFNYIVEASFFLDLTMNFLTEYIDPDTYQPVRSIPQIGR